MRRTILALFLGVLLHVENGDSAASCTSYQSQCNLLTAETCCGFPFNLCLPNVNSTYSCLFPLDVVNLSPLITSLNPFTPALQNLITSASNIMRLAFNPVMDPLVNPILDPLANPLLDPLVNPLVDPIVNPAVDPLVNPMYNPLARVGK